jgi:hypothetical protein
MKFSKPFRGVPDGEIYPVDYEAGNECPPELLASAIELEVVEQDQVEAKKPTRAKQ